LLLAAAEDAKKAAAKKILVSAGVRADVVAGGGVGGAKRVSIHKAAHLFEMVHSV